MTPASIDKTYFILSARRYSHMIVNNVLFHTLTFTSKICLLSNKMFSIQFIQWNNIIWKQFHQLVFKNNLTIMIQTVEIYIVQTCILRTVDYWFLFSPLHLSCSSCLTLLNQNTAFAHSRFDSKLIRFYTIISHTMDQVVSCLAMKWTGYQIWVWFSHNM